jgi:hypothetical protein
VQAQGRDGPHGMLHPPLLHGRQAVHEHDGDVFQSSVRKLFFLESFFELVDSVNWLSFLLDLLFSGILQSILTNRCAKSDDSVISPVS